MYLQLQAISSFHLCPLTLTPGQSRLSISSTAFDCQVAYLHYRDTALKKQLIICDTAILFTKILMYKVFIRPVLTYASETWTVSKTN